MCVVNYVKVCFKLWLHCELLYYCKMQEKNVVDVVAIAVMMRKPLKLLYCGCNCGSGRIFRTILCPLIKANEYYKKLLFVCMQEEWRVEMPSIQCFILKVQPKVDVRLRIKSNGEDYPSHVPHHISKILELHFVSTFIGIYLKKLTSFC